ncbi:MAG: hypothetical protein ACYDGY_09775 [Acidimicrobiales bacterium]
MRGNLESGLLDRSKGIPGGVAASAEMRLDEVDPSLDASKARLFGEDMLVEA